MKDFENYAETTLAELEAEFKRLNLGDSFSLELHDDGECTVRRKHSGEFIETYEELWFALSACICDLRP